MDLKVFLVSDRQTEFSDNSASGKKVGAGSPPPSLIVPSFSLMIRRPVSEGGGGGRTQALMSSAKRVPSMYGPTVTSLFAKTSSQEDLSMCLLKKDFGKSEVGTSERIPKGVA